MGIQTIWLGPSRNLGLSEGSVVGAGEGAVDSTGVGKLDCDIVVRKGKVADLLVDGDYIQFNVERSG